MTFCYLRNGVSRKQCDLLRFTAIYQIFLLGQYTDNQGKDLRLCKDGEDCAASQCSWDEAPTGTIHINVSWVSKFQKWWVLKSRSFDQKSTHAKEMHSMLWLDATSKNRI